MFLRRRPVANAMMVISQVCSGKRLSSSMACSHLTHLRIVFATVRSGTFGAFGSILQSSLTQRSRMVANTTNTRLTVLGFQMRFVSSCDLGTRAPPTACEA
jgi:hypothetical protein